MAPSSSTTDLSNSADSDDSSDTVHGIDSLSIQSEPAAAGDAPTMSSQASEALSRNFQELKSKNQDIRLKASYDLHSLIVSAARGRQITDAVQELD